MNTTTSAFKPHYLVMLILILLSSACASQEMIEEWESSTISKNLNSSSINLRPIGNKQPIFEADPEQGICYRSPQIIAVGKYLVAIAKKRYGYASQTTRYDHKRPHLDGDHFENIKPCADETLQSIVFKIAKVPNDTEQLKTEPLSWSSELELDTTDYIRRAIDPTSKFFEPTLYDYYLRLRRGDFVNDESNYEYANTFSSYLKRHFDLNTDQEVFNWIDHEDHAMQMMNLSIGGSSFGYVKNGKSIIGLVGPISYTTAPHIKRNSNQGGTRRMLTGLQIKVDSLWNQTQGMNRAKKLKVINQAFTWKMSFHRRVAHETIRVVENWLDTDVGRDAEIELDRLLTQSGPQSTRLELQSGIDDFVFLPQTAGEIIDIAKAYSFITDPMRGFHSPSQTLAYSLWGQAIQSIYNNTTDPDLFLRDDDKAQDFLIQHSELDDWDASTVREAHDALRIGNTFRSSLRIKKQKRLVAVMSAYARILNATVGFIKSQFKSKRQLGRAEASRRIIRLFFKSIRKGNAIQLSKNNRVYLNVGAGYPINMTRQFRSIQCNHDNFNITRGTERYATVIGQNRNGDDLLLMTLRHQHTQYFSENRSTIDLESWSRLFSYSHDSGVTWSADKLLPPQYENNIISNRDASLPRIKKSGFQSSEVQGSIATVPDFFGRGQHLIIHGHPQNNSQTIERGEDGKTVEKLGRSPGDAMKEGGRWDYRLNYTLIPGKRSERSITDNQNDPGRAVNWRFQKSLRLQEGSAGYSSITHVKRDGCQSAIVAAIFEGTPDNQARYRGFNDGIMLSLVRASGGDYSHLAQCRTR